MKLIKNNSVQSFTIFLKGEKGCIEKWLQPGQGIVVPDTYITEQINIMSRRRILSVTNA